MIKNLCVVLFALLQASCAHQSAIRPSQGHIDESLDKHDAASIPKIVKTYIVVPPPKLRAQEQTYSVVVNEVPVKEILFALARESKLNIDIHPGIQGRVTLNAVDQPLMAILARLAKQVDLTYRLENNVLTISPDLPVLRIYKIDYVNMSRDTAGYIGAATEISTTGRSAATGANAAVSSSNNAGNGANNSSRTAVISESKNNLWLSLIQNIRDLLAETDKEVIISRNSGTFQAPQKAASSGNTTSNEPDSASAELTSQTVKQDTELKEQARAEYKTLFAATVIASPETGVISVRATGKQHEKVREFLDKVMRSAQRQVLIEATIVEVQLSDHYQAGIDWSRLGNGFVATQKLGPTLATTVGSAAIDLQDKGLVAGYASSNLLASVQLLRQFGDTKVLSSPKLMVLNNQTAVLKVVNNLVYFTVQSQTSQAVNAGTTSAITTTPNTVPVGVVMSVTSQINDVGLVNLNVRPTISRVLSYVRDPNPIITVPSFIPQIQVREMESMLQVYSGKTAVLGGLMQDEVQRDADHVPGLYQLPWIGKLFTGRDDQTKKTELVIFLRPTVITDASLESEELHAYSKFLPSPQLEQAVSDAN